MLKMLAIVALSLSSIPLQADSQTNRGEQGKRGQKPASPVLSVPAQQKNSPQFQPSAEHDIQADVRVIQSPGKDGYDIAAFWISVALFAAGAFGVGAALKTLRAIERQADLMEKQLAEMKTGSEIAKRNADAASGTVTVALAQLDSLIAKERARLDIDAGRVEVSADDGPFGWDIRTSLKFRNIGSNRAYGIHGQATLTIRNASFPLDDLDWPDGLYLPFNYLDPISSPDEIIRSCSPESGATVESLADDLLESRKSIHLYGFIEYESLGIWWRKEFGWKWKTYGQLSYLVVATSPIPGSHEGRITSGYWQPDPEKDKPEYATERDQPQKPN